MTKQPKNDPANDLIADAMALIECYKDARMERNKIIADWSAQSPEHAEAIAMAEAELGLYAALPNPPPQDFERVQVGVEALAAHVVDHPARISVVAIGLATLLALPFTSFSGLSSPTVANVESDFIRNESNTSETKRHFTARGEQTRVVLEDGSAVWLDWDSEIQASFMHGERRIELTRGAAVFDVAHDPQHPFRVYADEILTKVMGTEFVIDKRDPGRIVFEVKEGMVALSTSQGGDPIRLTKAQAVTFEGGLLGEVHEKPPYAMGAWRDGILEFYERPLIEVLNELGRYTTADLQIGPLKDPESPVTATFFIDDADGALESVKDLFSLESETTRSSALLIQSKQE